MPIRNNYKYPLDLTGTNPENRKIGEIHTIGTTRGRIFIADHGPFYSNNLVVKDASNGRILEPKTDYLLIHQVREAQEASAKAVYCGIRIVNTDVSTQIEIDVNYVGGEFSYSTAALFEMLQTIIDDDRPVEWGALIGIPNEFTPTPHLHSAYDLYAMKHLVASTADVAAAIRETKYISNEQLFAMVDARIAVFEEIVPKLIEAYEKSERLLATLL